MKTASVQPLLWVFLLLLSAQLAASQTPGVPIGAPLPMLDRSFQDATHGTTAALGDLTGPAGTVIVFYCNHCLWVDTYEDRLLELIAHYTPAGFRFILVNANDPTNFPLDSYAKSRERAAARHYTFPYLMDPHAALAQALGAERTPQVYVFDAGRTLVYTGAIDDAPRNAHAVRQAYLPDALQALVQGDEIAVPVTKPFGCSIRCRLDP